MSDQRVPLAGSAPNTGLEPRWSSAIEPNEPVTATVTLRRQSETAAAEMEKQLLAGHTLPREQAEQQLSADPRDIAATRAFLEQHGLRVTEENAAARTLKVTGTVEQMGEAFSTRLGWVEDGGNRHLSYRGALSIPQSLDGIITSVIGLDQRPIARHREYRSG